MKNLYPFPRRTLPANVEPIALDLAAAAAYIGLGSVEAARWLIRTGKITPVKLGRRTLLLRKDLDALMEEGQRRTE